MTKPLFAIAIAAALSNSLACAQPTTKPTLEPGAAQSKEATTRPAITEFTHPAVETRGVWLASRDLLVPRDQLLAKLDQLKNAGFNRVMIDTQFRGYVLYPNSKILPQIPDAKGEDLLKLLIDECHKRGLKADAWMEYGFYAFYTPKKDDRSRGALIESDPSMMSVDAKGNGAIVRDIGIFYSICPANPKCAEILGQLDAEVATRYDVDAINLDRMRFASFDHLSMVGRERFEKETGIKWAAFDKASPEGQKLGEWKRQQDLASVRTICAAIRKAKPGLPITAYVVPPDEKDEKSQSWDLWMKEDLLDVISVSMYGADITDAANKAIKLLEGKTHKLIAAINSEQTTENLTTNIELSRKLGMIGQFDWFAGSLDDADTAALKAGPYAQPAKDVIGAPEARR